MEQQTNSAIPSDAEIAAAAGIASEDDDLPFLRTYLERAPWFKDIPTDILEEFLGYVYGGDSGTSEADSGRVQRVFESQGK